MINLTYEWKVDFAFIISVMAMIFSFAVWILDKRRTLKIERIRAYEEIYEDVCFILEFPSILRNRKIKQIHYINEDPELQKAVRMYVDSH